MFKEIYYIGGSPCAGKSTTAEILSKKYDLYYFKVDERLDNYMEMAAAKGYPICGKIKGMNWEQIWMREPELQCREEFIQYEEVFEFVMEDLKQLAGERPIITEGAAYVPQLMKRLNIPVERYISITPTAEFQIPHFKQREWISYILEGCSDKEKAFENWMQRDVLFAEEVRRQCKEEGYASIVNDGGIAIEDMVSVVERHFGFKI